MKLQWMTWHASFRRQKTASFVIISCDLFLPVTIYFSPELVATQFANLFKCFVVLNVIMKTGTFYLPFPIVKVQLYQHGCCQVHQCIWISPLFKKNFHSFRIIFTSLLCVLIILWKFQETNGKLEIDCAIKCVCIKCKQRW